MHIQTCMSAHAGEQLCSYTYVAAGLTAPLAVGVMVTEVSGLVVERRWLVPCEMPVVYGACFVGLWAYS